MPGAVDKLPSWKSFRHPRVPALQHPNAPQRVPIAFPVASRPTCACRRSLRSGLIGGERTAIRFEALFENVLVSTEARRNEEMLLRFGK